MTTRFELLAAISDTIAKVMRQQYPAVTSVVMGARNRVGVTLREPSEDVVRDVIEFMSEAGQRFVHRADWPSDAGDVPPERRGCALLVFEQEEERS